jgi:hypothetical protein
LFFWVFLSLNVLEVSFHGHLVLSLWVFVEAEHCGRENMVEQNCSTARIQKAENKRQKDWYNDTLPVTCFI